MANKAVCHAAQEACEHKRWPEWWMFLAWAGSYACLFAWLHNDMSWLDVAVSLAVYIVCAPLISHRTTPAVMAWIGGPICGTICGMQLIDLVFDLCIIQDISVSDGTTVIDGKRVAYLYYRTMLNATHVNAALLVIIVTSFLGSLIGLGRSSPKVRKQWLTLGGCTFVGTGGYFVSVVTRYIRIRDATVFDASLFDGWEMVLFARVQLYAALVVALPFMYSMSVRTPEEPEWDAIASKVHQQ